LLRSLFLAGATKSLGVDCEKRDASNHDDEDDDDDVAINLSWLILECYLITLKVCRKVGDFWRVPSIIKFNASLPTRRATAVKSD